MPAILLAIFLFSLIIILTAVTVLGITKFLTFPLDTGMSRRKFFPITGKRSHPSPQVCWHPALKITKNSDGLVDSEKLERNLQTECGLYTTKGGVKLFWQSYRPKTLDQVTHSIVILHGYSDHCDYRIRQQALTIATLNKAWVFIFDYQGHGRSDGLWCYISDWKLLIAQCAEIVEHVFLPQVRKLGKPIFCMGNSLGGAVAIHLSMLRSNLFRGVILMCPMCGIADNVKPPKPLWQALVFIAKFAGRLPITPGENLSHLVFKNQKFYESMYLGPHSNRLNYRHKTRLATGREILYASTNTISRARTDMRTPFLIIHGDSDYLCPIEKSEEFFNQAQVVDKRFEKIPGGWHGLDEHDLVKAFDVIFGWVNKRICNVL